MWLTFLLLLLPPGVEHRTEHYELYAEVVDATETGEMLEALHASLTAHFGSAPREKKPLRVEIYASVEGFQDALKRDKQPVPAAGGYYSPESKTAYLWVQPSEYFTRQLILHEATHQFHFLAATENKAPKAGWYVEGIAEYFGMHDWDGKRLRTGVVPALTLEDYPARAQENWEKLAWDVEAVGAGAQPCDRPEAWALFHYLIHNHPRAFRELAGELDSGKKPGNAWERAFGEASLGPALKKWIEANRQPWRILTIAWQQRGEVLEGEAASFGLAARAGLEEAEVELDAAAGTKAGIAFGVKSKEEYCYAFFSGEGAVTVRKRSGQVWSTIATGEAPASARPTFSVKRDGEQLVLAVNGKEIGRFEAGGEAGIFIEGGTARFRVIR